MASYFFTLTKGQKAVGGRQPTELAGFAEVQDEAIAFGQSRVLAVVPLSRIKRIRSTTEWSTDDHPIALAGVATEQPPGLRADVAQARPYDRAY